MIAKKDEFEGVEKVLADIKKLLGDPFHIFKGLYKRIETVEVELNSAYMYFHVGANTDKSPADNDYMLLVWAPDESQENRHAAWRFVDADGGYKSNQQIWTFYVHYKNVDIKKRTSEFQYKVLRHAPIDIIQKAMPFMHVLTNSLVQQAENAIQETQE